MALGTVTVTALGCLVFLDKSHAASPGRLSTIAILLVILNIAFLVLVALAVIKQGRSTFLTKAQAISKAALRLVKAAFSFLKAPFAQKAAFGFLGAPFVRKGRQPCLQLTRPRPNMAVRVRATRTESLQPMLAEMIPSQPNSSFSSWSQDSTRP